MTDQRPEEPTPPDLGLAGLDAAASTSWLAVAGWRVGLLPLALAIGFILFALVDPRVGLATVAVIVGAVALRPRRRGPH